MPWVDSQAWYCLRPQMEEQVWVMTGCEALSASVSSFANYFT